MASERYGSDLTVVDAFTLTGRSVPEWIGGSPDSNPPKSVYDRIWLRQHGRDAITGARIAPGDKTALDHIVPLKDGGQNRETNLQIITAETHAAKTAGEATERAKERRIRLKHAGLWPKSKRPMKSRGFQKRKEI